MTQRLIRRLLRRAVKQAIARWRQRHVSPQAQARR
jgi:hypothetical protein